MRTGTRWDALGPTGRRAINETPPDQAGMTHHHPPGAKTGAHPHKRLSVPPGRTVRRPNNETSVQREPSRPHGPIGRPR